MPSLIERLAGLATYAFIASIPLDAIGIDGIGSPSVILGIVFSAVALMHVLVRGTTRRFTVAHLVLVVFVLWAGASIFWAKDEGANLIRVGTYLQLCVFVLLLWQSAAQDERATENMAASFVAGGYVAAISTIYTFTTGETYRAYMERFAGLGYDPNDLALTLALGLVFAWFVAIRRKGWARWLAVGYFPISLGAVALTASRGGALSVLAATSVIPLSARRLRARAKAATLALGAVAVIGLVQFIPDTSWERLGTATSELSGGTMTGRTELWKVGWDVFESNWLIGVGAGGFPDAARVRTGSPHVAHNTVLEVGAELGIVGATLFVAMWVILARHGRRLGELKQPVFWALLGTLAIGTFALSWEFRKPTWFVAAFLVHLVACSRKRRLASGCDVRFGPSVG